MKKQLFLGVLLLLLTSTVIAQKPNHDGYEAAASDKPYIWEAKPDERTQFLIKILPQNDTVKIGQLLQAGVKLNVRATDASDQRYYRTVLMYAINHCNKYTIGFLLRHGADPNLRVLSRWYKNVFNSEPTYTFSMYPLETAAEKKSMDIIKLLVHYGADISRCTTGLQTIASNTGNMELMRYLNNNTEVSGVDDNALAVMTDFSYEHNAGKVTVKMIEQLINGGADVNAYSRKGKTALINVIQNEQIKDKLTLAKALLKYKADPNKPDRKADNTKGVMKFYPTSPLVAAIRMGNLEMVKLLVESGANVNQSDGDNRPLHYANSDAIKEYLILHGAK